jgi:predicted nucleic acid-binding protein
MAAGSFFLDTNVLVYANDRTEAAKQSAAVQLIADGIQSGRAVISSQVLGEFWVTVTQKIQVPLDRRTAEREIEHLRTMQVVSIEYDTVRTAIRLQERHRVSYWDALILAAASLAGCTQVYSEDLNAGQRYGRLVVRNPFAATGGGSDVPGDES